MAKKREERNSGGRDLQARLTALAGLVVIVGSAAAILFAVGVLGGQGGGTTATGIKIEDVIPVCIPNDGYRGVLHQGLVLTSMLPNFVRLAILPLL